MIDMPAPRLSDESQNTAMTIEQKGLMWVLFFLICLGLGYAPLNRYDPGKVIGTSDAAVYRDIVTGVKPVPSAAAASAFERLAEVENQYRLLVPYVARPFYWLARGRVGTWDPALFGLLVANAIFTATTACLLVAIGLRLRLNRSTALLGATLYLLNFCVANLYLAGLVDSAEGCFFIVIVWSLLYRPLVSAAPLGSFRRTRQGNLRTGFRAVRLRLVDRGSTTRPPATPAPGMDGGVRFGEHGHGNACGLRGGGGAGLALAISGLYAFQQRVRRRSAVASIRPEFLVHPYLAAPLGAHPIAPPAPVLDHCNGAGLRRSINPGRLP